MKVLFLGNIKSSIIEFLVEQGCVVEQKNEILNRDVVVKGKYDFLVSHGYRYILKPDILELFPNSAINLHISLLPWNRGADPNFWSFLENTPKGISIHVLNEGVDTGDIICQKEILFEEEKTLKTTYERLQKEIHQLFIKNWTSIKTGCFPRIEQNPDKGTVHRKRDKEPFKNLLTDGWDTPVALLIAHGKKTISIKSKP